MSRISIRLAPLAAFALAAVLAVSAYAAAAGDPLARVDPASLAPEGILSHGPNGEAPASASVLKLTAAEAARARKKHFKVGIVMQTMDIDWSTLQVRGMKDTLAKYGAKVIGVTNADFKVEKQISDIQNMVQRKPDAIISIPVDNTATAAAYKKIAQAGIKLVLIHQVPRGLRYPKDYSAVISPDNQGNGQIAAAALARYVPKGGTVGIIGFGVDFFTTNERVVRFKQWMKENRPDVKLKESDFLDPSKAGDTASNFLTANGDVKGLFVVWDAPAMQVVSAERQQGKRIPITTIDLGNQVALELAKSDGLVKALGAQQPYDQGVAEALAVLKTLLGKKTPPWVVLPAVPVTQKNVLETYRAVFHEAPPGELAKACKGTRGCG